MPLETGGAKHAKSGQQHLLTPLCHPSGSATDHVPPPLRPLIEADSPLCETLPNGSDEGLPPPRFKSLQARCLRLCFSASFFAYNRSYNFTPFLRAFYTRFYNFTHVPKPTCANTLNTRIFYVKLRQLATASPAPLGRFSSQAPTGHISHNNRRNPIRAVKAAVKWAEEQEHIDRSPIRHFKVPAAVPRRPGRSLAGTSRLQASMNRLNAASEVPIAVSAGRAVYYDGHSKPEHDKF